MNLDHKLSHGLFHAAKKRGVTRAISVFGASYLIWVMIGAAIGNDLLRRALGVEVLWFETVWGQVLVALPAFFFAFVITVLVGRTRPYLELDVEGLIDPYVKTSSFPSIHTTVAFAGATLFWGTPLGVFMFVCAVIVALSRVAVGVHFVSDIIVGALIGVTVTFMFMLSVGFITLIL
jgi:undecaprenyl-diphosphatase